VGIGCAGLTAFFSKRSMSIPLSSFDIGYATASLSFVRLATLGPSKKWNFAHQKTLGC
jgi:hypothetical protein